MRTLLAACAACALLAAAAPAGSQTAAPSPTPAAERPKAGEAPINLRLDEAPKPRPRINFGPPAPALEQGPTKAASDLPSLGGPRGPTGSAMEIPMTRPYPKNTDPVQ